MAVKRKSAIQQQDDEESLQEVPLHDSQLDMLSEEENEDLESDDGAVDDFPELNVQSGSDGSETGYSTTEDDDDSAQNSDDSESVNSRHLFSKPKNVVSDITNQPKLVYPEIEPDYDSDSSTEDVSFYLPLYDLLNMV
jgi:ribosome biogenesis protein ERB1